MTDKKNYTNILLLFENLRMITLKKYRYILFEEQRIIYFNFNNIPDILETGLGTFLEPAYTVKITYNLK